MNATVYAPRSELSLRDYAAAAKRHKKLMLKVGLGIGLVALLLALFLPPVYRSQATILIEQQEIPVDLVRSTVTSFADQRIQVISQRVMTSSNLKTIVEKYNLYPNLRLREPIEVVLDKMREDVHRDMISANVVDPKIGKSTEATIAFTLSFDSRSPTESQQVTSELASLFLSENLKSRTGTAAEAATFLSDEAETLREKVRLLEGKLAEFKTTNGDAQPGLEQVNREMLNRNEMELAQIEQQLRAAQQQKIFTEAEMAQTDPYRGVAIPGELSAYDRLQATEAELSATQARYGESHPDVVRLRKTVDALRAQVKPGAARKIFQQQLEQAQSELATARKKYGSEHPDVSAAERKVATIQEQIAETPDSVAANAPDNPTYLSLKARLESADSEIRSLSQQRATLRAKIDQQLENIAKTPKVEAEYRALSRDYEAALRKYEEISSKQMEARLSENLETERKGEKFTLIEPALVPEEPAKPNRVAILAIGLLFATVGGFGSGALAESLDTRIHGRRGIQELLTAPPLAVVPIIFADQIDTRTRVRRVLLVLGGLVAVMIALAVVHFTYKPLDVLWFIITRKAGF